MTVAVGYPAWWDDLPGEPGRDAIVRHLGFLCDSDGCRDILDRIAAVVSRVEIGTNEYWPDEPD